MKMVDKIKEPDGLLLVQCKHHDIIDNQQLGAYSGPNFVEPLKIERFPKMIPIGLFAILTIACHVQKVVPVLIPDKVNTLFR